MFTVVRAVVALLVGTVIFAGLPLSGWGLDDVQGFLNHPARLGYLVLATTLQVLVVLIFSVGAEQRTGKRKVIRRQRVAVFLLQVFPLAIVIEAPYGDRRDFAVMAEPDFVRYVGLALFTFGFMLVSWAQAALGKQFSVQVAIQEGHRLVTEGLYRYLRHPRYLGIILFSLGIALAFRSWLSLAFMLAATLVLLWRIHDEEALLHQEFGAEWEAYCKRSWRLFPFVY